ncbi:rhodanese-like domain-containing protein [Aliiglaciecola litoralis]|uniref:Rhodanese-like domain-containing protein n=1 Tax=Aliiglaciecola litoralis TaxID=582857 RepID=A0ABN1LRC7_9ALTE
MLKNVPELVQLAAKNVRRIDADTATRELENNKGLLIDVREPAEHQAKGAKGAINIPRGLLEMKVLEIEKDPNRAIYLHCATSVRAILSAEQLARIGFNNVSVITCDLDTIQKACE